MDQISDKLTLLKEEVAVRGLQITEIGTKVGEKVFSKEDYYKKAAELMNLSQQQLTSMLWEKYDPSRIWIYFTAIGAATVVALFLYDKLLLNDKKQ